MNLFRRTLQWETSLRTLSVENNFGGLCGKKTSVEEYIVVGLSVENLCLKISPIKDYLS